MTSLKRIVLRGDQKAYKRVGNSFPYVDHAAEAGATGVHIWFWKEPFFAVQRDFFAYCQDRNLEVHLGVGVGAYGVCDGEDPTEPAVQLRIKDHVSWIVDTFPVAGIEFQNGEYDQLAYQGASTRGKTRARQVVEQLNPIVDHALSCKRELWIRTELNAECFSESESAEIARGLDPRCTVEWSRFTGPYRGPDAFERGRKLLAQGQTFSWFLKIVYNGDRHWQEIASDVTPAQMQRWVEHWRGWVRLLRDAERPTLTICNVDAAYVEEALPMPAAAVALAKDPELPADQVLRRFFS